MTAVSLIRMSVVGSKSSVVVALTPVKETEPVPVTVTLPTLAVKPKQRDLQGRKIVKLLYSSGF